MALIQEAENLANPDDTAPAATQIAGELPTPVQTAATTAPTQPRTTADIFQEQQGITLEALQSDDPLLALARSRSIRPAQRRGLAQSSLSARAAEGAAQEYVAPRVARATELSSMERTAFEERQARATEGVLGRESTERLAGQELASRAELQTQALSSEETQQLRDLQNKRDLQGAQLTATEENLIRELESREQLQAGEIQSRESMQIADIRATAENLGRQLTADEESQIRELENNVAMQQTALTSQERQQLAELNNKLFMQGVELTSLEDLQRRELENKVTMQQYAFNEEENAQLRDLASRAELLGTELSAQERMSLAELQSRKDLQTAALGIEQELQAERLAFEEEEANRKRFSDAVIQRVDIDARADLQQLIDDNALAAQQLDIDYRLDLEEISSQHEQLLVANTMASNIFNEWIRMSTDIYNNELTSREQKVAAVDALKTTVDTYFNAFADVEGVDLSGISVPSPYGAYLKSNPAVGTQYEVPFTDDPIADLAAAQAIVDQVNDDIASGATEPFNNPDVQAALDQLDLAEDRAEAGATGPTTTTAIAPSEVTNTAIDPAQLNWQNQATTALYNTYSTVINSSTENKKEFESYKNQAAAILNDASLSGMELLVALGNLRIKYDNFFKGQM